MKIGHADISLQILFLELLKAVETLQGPIRGGPAAAPGHQDNQQGNGYNFFHGSFIWGSFLRG